MHVLNHSCSASAIRFTVKSYQPTTSVLFVKSDHVIIQLEGHIPVNLCVNLCGWLVHIGKAGRRMQLKCSPMRRVHGL